MAVLSQINCLAGQGFIFEGMPPRTHAPRAFVAGYSQYGLPAQGLPGLENRERTGDMP
jgi:hypothetical protein